MAVMKHYENSEWVVLDAVKLDTVNGLYFRVFNSKLQYSTNNVDWVDAT